LTITQYHISENSERPVKRGTFFSFMKIGSDKEETVKVTIALSKGSVEFFKREAKKHHTQYQRMIRRLIDFYVDQQLGRG